MKLVPSCELWYVFTIRLIRTTADLIGSSGKEYLNRKELEILYLAVIPVT